MTMNKYSVSGGKRLAIALSFLYLSSFLALPMFAQSPVSPVGDWQGMLEVGAAKLPIVFHINSEGTSGFTATMDSPDQGAMGIPVTSVLQDGNAITITMTAIGGEYKGTLNEDGQSMDGTWSQGGQSFSLDLEKTDTPTTLPERPQEPKAPFPYEAEEVVFPNASAGIELAGTLTYPNGDGPFPVAVLISGSGPQDRDETLMGHKPFLVLADHLTRQGIAVLRYDDRGTAASTGNYSEATIEDFALDTRAAVAFLKKQPQIASDKIGLIGHSEGGIVAPMVASQSDDIAFVVMLAGPGLQGNEILLLQSDLIARAAGTPESLITKMLKINSALYDAVISTGHANPSKDRLEEVIAQQRAGLTDQEITALGLSEDRTGQLVQQLSSPWFKHFLSYDPRPALGRVKAPLLSVIGEKDLQVPPNQNTEAIKKALASSGHQNNVYKILSGLNHLFQSANTGAPAEYAQIEETFSPGALSTISEWVLAQVK